MLCEKWKRHDCGVSRPVFVHPFFSVSSSFLTDAIIKTMYRSLYDRIGTH